MQPNTTAFAINTSLVHLLDQSIDLVFPVTQVTTLDEVPEFPGLETTSWVAELKWPQKVASLLEVGADSEDLVDQIFNADDAVRSEIVLDKLVVGKRNTLLVDLAVTALVNKLADGLQVRVAIGDPWLDDLKHLKSGFGKADKDAIVDLEETEKLEDLARFGSDLVDTFDTNNEDKLGFGRDVVRAFLLAQSSEPNLLLLCITVLLDVRLGTLEDNATLLLVSLLSLLKLSRTLLALLLLALALFQEGLWDEDLVLGGYTPVNRKEQGQYSLSAKIMERYAECRIAA